MTVTDELVQNAERYAEDFDRGDLPLPPARKVADRRLHGRAARPVTRCSA